MAATVTTAAILKSILNFFSWSEKPIESKLDRKYRGDLSSRKHAYIIFTPLNPTFI